MSEMSWMLDFVGVEFESELDAQLSLLLSLKLMYVPGSQCIIQSLGCERMDDAC